MKISFSNIKYIISEVDGIVTEHLVGMGEFNSVLFKQYYMKDFEAINRIKKHFGFVFISADAAISTYFLKKKHIPFYYAERSKKTVYINLLRRFNVTPDNVLFVGSSYSDIECMKMSKISVCPEDAVPQVKNICDHVVPVYGGNGVLVYVYEMIYEYLLYKGRGE